MNKAGRCRTSNRFPRSELEGRAGVAAEGGGLRPPGESANSRYRRPTVQGGGGGGRRCAVLWPCLWRPGKHGAASYMTRHHPPLANVSNAGSKKAARLEKGGPGCRESSASRVAPAAGGQTDHLVNSRSHLQSPQTLISVGRFSNGAWT